MWDVGTRSREGDARRKRVTAGGESVFEIGSVYRHYRKAIGVEDRATRERLGEDKQEDVVALKSTGRLVP